MQEQRDQSHGVTMGDSTDSRTASAVSGVVSDARIPLTKRQREVLDYVIGHIGASGYAPSLAEIGAAVGVRSLSTVHKHLENLRIHGYITRHKHRNRSVQVLPVCGACPMCGR